MRLLIFVMALLVTLPAVAEKVDFTLADLDGKPVSLSDFRGKWVIVNYWATWCPPCLEEIPDLVDEESTAYAQKARTNFPKAVDLVVRRVIGG